MSARKPSRLASQPTRAGYWHELGHVLLMACVGEPQFHSAHSPGDALAAIVADPRSELAKDANWRGATFPWVFLPRRHDRSVAQGWSWGGSLHYALSKVPEIASAAPQGLLDRAEFSLHRCSGSIAASAATLRGINCSTSPQNVATRHRTIASTSS